MRLILIFSLSFATLAYGQHNRHLPIHDIIPEPVKLTESNAGFQFGLSTPIAVVPRTPEAFQVAQLLQEKLSVGTFNHFPITDKLVNGIRLQLNDRSNPLLGQEGYELRIDSENVIIYANTAAGLFYGTQTLLQLIPPRGKNEGYRERRRETILQGMEIIDYPRFAWRGLMLDVSRHFFDTQFMKSYIDQMAAYKFNRLHWHLTDDNGWRVEIKSLPRLTEVGSLRVPRTGTFGSNMAPQPGEGATDGGFYTQDDIREIVKYARDRYVEILPEIDVPGHSMAALASYPELSITKDPKIQVNPGSKFSTWYGNGKFSMEIENTLNPSDENTYQFLDKVFTEIAQLFPFEYIHMGGDECYKGFWEQSPAVQAFMKKNKIQNGVELQAYFNKRVNKIINDKNKKMIGWDEILEGGIANNASVMSWRGVKGGIEATQHKHKVVMSPAPVWYLDMMQGDPTVEAPIYNTARLKDVYAFDIIVPGIDSAYVLGGQGNLWTEQIAVEPQIEYMTYPRAFAIAEALWTPAKKKDWNGFVKRTEAHFVRLDSAGVNYATSMYDPIINVSRTENGLLQVELIGETPDLDFHYSFDNSTPGPYHPKYDGRIVLSEDADIFRVISCRRGKPIGHLISIKTEDLAKRIKK